VSVSEALAPYLVPGGLSGLVLAVAWMVFVGKLVPARIHDRIIADKDMQIATLQAAYDKATGQRDELMELARTTVAIVQALPKVRDPA
jgi:amino acid permease